MVLVGAEPGGVVIASDTVHTYEELEQDWPFISLVDVRGMYETLEQIRELERGGAVIVAGHDPDVVERFPAAPGSAASCAVRIVAPVGA
jgi:glyoxylase-like metal-dependent hydrolase (beta-lactamase superfamily II)